MKTSQSQDEIQLLQNGPGAEAMGRQLNREGQSQSDSYYKPVALARLRKLLPEGSTVYTILRRRSRSGMQRKIGVLVISPETATLRCAEPILLWPNWDVALVTGMRLDRKDGQDGIIVKGCGMDDAGGHLVQRLSYALYGEEGQLKQRWV